MKKTVLMGLILCTALSLGAIAQAKDKHCHCKEKDGVQEIKKESRKAKHAQEKNLKSQDDSVNMLNLNRDAEPEDSRSPYLKEQIYSW